MKELATPTNWHWQITPEEIERIKAQDIDTINTVFMANYEKFRKIAYNYCRKFNRLDFVDDCVNQIYVDFANYRFKDCGTMFWDMRNSFRTACLYQGSCLSLETPLKGKKSDEDGQTLGDIVPDTSPTADEQIELTETERESAPQIISCLCDIFRREKWTSKKERETKFRTLLEYIYPKYEYAEIQAMAG